MAFFSSITSKLRSLPPQTIMLRNIVKYTIIIFSIVGLILFCVFMFRQEFYNTFQNVDSNAGTYGDFIGGFIGTFFALISALLIVLTLTNQIIDKNKNAIIEQFFKMLDYHLNNVEWLEVKQVLKSKENEGKVKNRRAFVIFKIQFTRLLDCIKKINIDFSLGLTEIEIADIAYVIFYYGLDPEWKELCKSKLSKKYNDRGNLIIDRLLIMKKKLKDKCAICRTNQTSVSAYFRNMYNTIKLVDSSAYLSAEEKKQYITILRAQLSNPELYILYFNVISRFGTKWRESGYITKYEFIKNLPCGYCSGYDPARDFPMIYEEDELT